MCGVFDRASIETLPTVAAAAKGSLSAGAARKGSRRLLMEGSGGIDAKELEGLSLAAKTEEEGSAAVVNGGKKVRGHWWFGRAMASGLLLCWAGSLSCARSPVSPWCVQQHPID